MAGIWRLHCNRRKNGNCDFCYQKIFYLHFLFNTWLAGYILFVSCFLDEHKKLYPKIEAQSTPVFIKANYFSFFYILFNINMYRIINVIKNKCDFYKNSKKYLRLTTIVIYIYISLNNPL